MGRLQGSLEEKDESPEWAFDRIEEAFKLVAQDETEKMSIVQEIMLRSTDYLRRIIAPVGGQRGVAMSSVAILAQATDLPREWLCGCSRSFVAEGAPLGTLITTSRVVRCSEAQVACAQSQATETVDAPGYRVQVDATRHSYQVQAIVHGDPTTACRNSFSTHDTCTA